MIPNPYTTGAIAFVFMALLATTAVQCQSAKVAKAEAAAATVEADLARKAAEMERRNARLALGLTVRAIDRERLTAAAIAQGVEEIEDARTEVPAQCRPALRPLDVALARMRREEGGGREATGPTSPEGTSPAGAAGQG